MSDLPAFYVRDIPIFGELILSPMDGFSDQPFRGLCRSLGSAMSYTEFINALDVLQGHPHLWRKLPFNHLYWHLFSLAGSVVHFVGIWLLLDWVAA